MTWQPMGASFPQVHPITSHRELECPLFPLPQVTQVSSCQVVSGQSLESRGVKVANLPEGERKYANPSRGEVWRALGV